MQDLCEKATAELQEWETTEDAKEDFRQGLLAARKILAPRSLDQAVAKLDGGAAAVLSLLAKQSPQEPEISKEYYTELREVIADFRKIIAENQLPPTLKKCLLEIIRYAEEAIALYEIHGQDGFVQAYKKVIAEAVFLSALSPETGDVINKTGAGERLRKMISVMDKVVTRVTGYERFGETVMKMLDSGAFG